jgi:CheY-like chemotaxis protein
MITTCPHCQKQLKLGAKIESGLRMLSPGKSIRINCPQCTGAILLDSSMLTPEPLSRQTDTSLPSRTDREVTPPPPPDLSSLSNITIEGKEIIEDIPRALLLLPDSPDRRLISQALEALGYQPSIATSADEAMDQMQFINYACVVLHSHYEGSTLENGAFHQFMRDMSMSKRRYIFYLIVGPEFHTLYNLQALASSANLVVNTKDLPQLAIILRTAIPQYESMFGAIMQEMNALGR